MEAAAAAEAAAWNWRSLEQAAMPPARLLLVVVVAAAAALLANVTIIQPGKLYLGSYLCDVHTGWGQGGPQKYNQLFLYVTRGQKFI